MLLKCMIRNKRFVRKIYSLNIFIVIIMCKIKFY